jgi:tetratricopeptide (TPR) repeat protein
MRVLFATGSPPAYMLPPQLGDEQVNCGPDWTDESGPDGRARSLATPVGSYDLAAVAAKLPPGQKPDVVVCLIDSSRRSMPRNLAAFRCPRVLLVADTHHLSAPLIGTLRYVAGEPFDRIVVVYDRHHAAFLFGAGLRNLLWFPGLTLPHGDAAVRAARHDGSRARRIGFVGQSGKHHPRRSGLLDALKAGGLPLVQQAIPQAGALGFYGASLVGFNASLNGDLNLRVFEILAAGGALLTDRLAPQSGLSRLLTEGKEVATYGSQEELVERAAHLMAHPSEALAMGVAGAEWFDRNFSEAWRRKAFAALAFDGTPAPGFEFSPAEKIRVYFGGNNDLLLRSMMAYEHVQELHRTQESVSVSLEAGAPADFTEMCSTLPRVAVVQAGAAADLAVSGSAQLGGLSLAGTKSLWCWDAKGAEVESMASALAPRGLALASRDAALFSKGGPAAQEMTAEGLASEGRALFEKGDLKGALHHAQAALQKAGKCVEALVLFGEIALARGGGPFAEKLFIHALGLRERDLGIEALLGDALRIQGKHGLAAECYQRILRGRPRDLKTLLSLAGIRVAEGDLAEAETALRLAQKHHPASAAAAHELGNCLKRQGRILEAVEWHRRALGHTGPVRTPRIGARRRAMFVVQHPSTWTSMASIVAAFRADPLWETTLVALPYNHPYLPDPADRAAIFGFLEQEGLPFVRWDQFPLAPDCADVLFLQNPYDVTRPAGWRTQELIRLVPRIAYAPYAIEIGGTREDTTHQFNQPLQNLAWAVFARSEEHRALFAKHGAAGNAHVVETGHPKFDLLCSLPETPPASEFSVFAKGRPIVVWNPQFDIRADGSGYSTFLTWWKFLPEEFARRPGLAFVIRPHPLFFTTLEARRLLTRAQVDDFIARCSQAGNVLIDRGPSYLSLFAAAAAIISDGASFLLEFGATGKPVCYLHNPLGPFAHLDYELDLDFVRRECAWAQSEGDIVRFLDGVKAAGGPAQAARAAAARLALSVNPDGAGAGIKRYVDARLDAEQDQVFPRANMRRRQDARAAAAPANLELVSAPDGAFEAPNPRRMP